MQRICIFLLFVTGLANAQRGDVLYCFDFGGAFQDIAPGYTAVSRVYHSPRYLWIDNVREIEYYHLENPLLKDFVSSDKGEFRLGLDNGSYFITLIMHDACSEHGPFSIFIQDSLVTSNITVEASDTLFLSYPARINDQVLKIRLLSPSHQGSFILNGLTIRGQAGKSLRKLFEKAPPDQLPTVDEVFEIGLVDTRQTLKSYCDWLLAHRLPNGFLGDYERGAKGTRYWWYTSAYPIRTLLAAYDIFAEERYLKAVTQILDKLVQEQLPNGAWHQTYRNKPTSKLGTSELDSIMTTQWMNLADIGSIATALGVSIQYVDAQRKERYEQSLKRFCREWAMQWQQPSGGFTNGMESGVARKREYSVATATQTAAFTALYCANGDKQFLRVAEHAAWFLLQNWKRDGRPISHAHISIKEGAVYNQPVTHFGDNLYYSDGILMLYHHTEDSLLKNKIEQVYGWYLKGEKGLLNALHNRSWFALQDAWNNSKTAGIPLAFLVYQRICNDAAIDRAIAMFKRFLCTPAFAHRIGIMVEDADLPWGKHSLQTWACCSISATGFAGLSVAEMIRPGVVFIRR
jgi:hypothetical protein